VASVVGFTVAELTDLAVYTPLRQHADLRAAVASNQVGAVVDTALFLSISGFPLAAMPGQLVGKHGRPSLRYLS
jgi:queuosine precursor transporter